MRSQREQKYACLKLHICTINIPSNVMHHDAVLYGLYNYNTVCDIQDIFETVVTLRKVYNRWLDTHNIILFNVS